MDRHTINLEFFASYELFEQIPSLNCQEIAFVGASNSGKSSAINLLANNKKLSYTSKKPGKTKLFNYFKKDNNFIVDFPGSSLREKALFYRFDSAYQLATKSVESKRQERLEKAKSYYSAFKKLYAQSEFIEDAEKMNEDINKQLEQYSTNS